MLQEDDFLRGLSHDNNDKVGILYDALQDKADVVIPNKKLHIAASKNDVSEIRHLVSEGIPVDVRGQAGMTPLSVASGFGHIEAIDTLLELGANINAPDVVGRSPLVYAVVSGQSRAVEHLLNKNAKVNQGDIMDDAPILFAVRHNHLNIFHILVSRGADLMSKTVQGWTLLHTAIFFREVKDRAHMIEAILDAVGDDWPEPGIINWPTPIAEASPLHWAAFYGRTDAVNVLVDRGASLTSINEDGELPIHVAARVNHKNAFLKLRDANP